MRITGRKDFDYSIDDSYALATAFRLSEFRFYSKFGSDNYHFPTSWKENDNFPTFLLHFSFGKETPLIPH